MLTLKNTYSKLLAAKSIRYQIQSSTQYRKFTQKPVSELTKEDIEKEMKIFEELNSQVYEVDIEGFKNQTIPNNITDDTKLPFIFDKDRTQIDFMGELNTIEKHQEIFTRPRMNLLMQKVYIPKFKAKAFSSYVYGPEDQYNMQNYKHTVNMRRVFGNPDRSKDEVILGIESSFDNSATALVNSFGEIKAINSIDMWDQWETVDGVDPRVAAERHAVNLPLSVESVIDEYKISKNDQRLKAIAVTIGPGQDKSLQEGIKLAQKLGNEYNVQVIPVNHLEGHVLTSRFSLEDRPRQNFNEAQVPLIPFPYVSVLVTGKHTEIVLNRGVGIHTILGTTVDIAAGAAIDKATAMLFKNEKVLFDDVGRIEFMNEYNQNNQQDQIPQNYFDFLKQKNSHRGGMLEKLAKYGDPSEFEFPVGFRLDPNADVTFSGLRTQVQSCFYVKPEDSGIPIYEREPKSFTFKQLLNFSASVQFSVIKQISNKTKIALDWVHNQRIQLNALVILSRLFYNIIQNFCGGVSCNEEMRRMLGEVADQYNIPLTYSPKSLCTDNAAMIAWMGWELKNCNQDVDIRQMRINALRSIPLGSYVVGLINHKNPDVKKIATAKQNEVIFHSQKKIRGGRNWQQEVATKDKQ